MAGTVVIGRRDREMSDKPLKKATRKASLMSGGPVCAIAIILGVWGNLCDGADQKQPSAASVAGEVIVKFKDSSKAGKMVQDALRAGAQPDPALTAYLAKLSEEIRIPFRAKQLTSGGEVVLSVQQQELTSRLREKLKQNHHVAEAEELDEKEKTGPQGVGNQVRVTFRPGSREARALEKTPGDAKSLGADLRKFVDGLEKQLEFAVLTRVSEKQEFMLAVNVNAVTSNLVERLKKRDDVQYAQPNFLLQKIGVGMSVIPF